MHEFMKAFRKLAAWVAIAAAVLLLGLAALLLFAPELVGKVLHWGLLILCVLAGVGILVSLIRMFKK